MAQIIRHPHAGRRPSGNHAIPVPLYPEVVEEVLRRARKDGYTLDEVQFAVDEARSWCKRRGQKAWRADWAEVIIGGMRRGDWLTKGFEGWVQRKRNSDPTYRVRVITEERIQGIVARAKAYYGEPVQETLDLSAYRHGAP